MYLLNLISISVVQQIAFPFFMAEGLIKKTEKKMLGFVAPLIFMRLRGPPRI